MIPNPAPQLPQPWVSLGIPQNTPLHTSLPPASDWGFYRPLPSPPPRESRPSPLVATQYVPVEINEEEFSISDVEFQEGPYKGTPGLRVQLRITAEDSDLLWKVFEESKERLAMLLSREAGDMFGREYDVVEIHYHRGSIILTIIVAIKAKALILKGIFAVVSFIFTAYSPAKAIAKDLKRVTKRVTDRIKVFFRNAPKQQPKLIGQT